MHCANPLSPERKTSRRYRSRSRVPVGGLRTWCPAPTDTAGRIRRVSAAFSHPSRSMATWCFISVLVSTHSRALQTASLWPRSVQSEYQGLRGCHVPPSGGGQSRCRRSVGRVNRRIGRRNPQPRCCAGICHERGQAGRSGPEDRARRSDRSRLGWVQHGSRGNGEGDIEEAVPTLLVTGKVPDWVGVPDRTPLQGRGSTRWARRRWPPRRWGPGAGDVEGVTVGRTGHGSGRSIRDGRYPLDPDDGHRIAAVVGDLGAGAADRDSERSRADVDYGGDGMRGSGADR